MRALGPACSHCGEEGHILHGDGVCVTCHDEMTRTCDACHLPIGGPGEEPLVVRNGQRLCPACLDDARRAARAYAAAQRGYCARKRRLEERES